MLKVGRLSLHFMTKLFIEIIAGLNAGGSSSVAGLAIGNSGINGSTANLGK